MIQIEVLGKGFLDLDPSTNISFERISPLFKESIVQQGYSYPIAIPPTPGNIQKLGFPHLPDNSAPIARSYPIQLWQNSLPFKMCSLRINKAEPQRIQGFVLESPIPQAVFDTPLRQIYMGGDRVVVGTGLSDSLTDHANESLSHTADDWDYVFFPVKNDLFHDGQSANQDLPLSTPHTFTGVVNLWDFQNQSFWRPYSVSNQLFMGPDEADSYVNYDVPPSQSAFVPFPYAYAVVRYIAKFVGNYAVVGDFFADTTMKRLVVYNTVSLDKIVAPISELPQNHGEDTINLANHVPDITVKEFLDGLAAMFNLYMDFDPQTLRLTIGKKTPADSEIDLTTASEQDKFTIEPGVNQQDGVMLSLSIDEDDGIAQDADDTVLTTDRIEDDYNGTPSYQPGQIYFSIDQYRDVVVGALKRGQDFFTKAPKLKIADGKVEKNIGAGTPKTAKNLPIKFANINYTLGNITPAVYDSGIIPHVAQIGNSKVYLPGQTNKFTLRFLFFAGMHPSPIGSGDYPVGTSNIYDDMGNPILPYSIKWLGGPHALYPTWHQPWFNTISGKILTTHILLHSRSFTSFDFKMPVRLKNRLYLVRKMAAPLRDSQYVKVKCELVQL